MSRTTKQPAVPETKRCAIYTRKSVAKGLEQQFNSLDAQREACLGYIQRQPGWVLVETRYDDGGFTGANIDRPAFQQLLADVEAGKIDVVVVYKVDRLSRSLLDFTGVMERLNKAGASFVSVTQNFSTADSMGRLTLNMLMSFAQFEREMIAERTRDKIHAARRRGKWTGGVPPFGYTRKDKRLVPDELEAPILREAFALLLEHQHVPAVVRTLNAQGKWPRGDRLPNGKSPRWNNDSLTRHLRNVVYAGKITAGDDVCQGEHQPLVDAATFERAQAILDAAAKERTAHGLNPDYVLRGLLHCSLCGAMMTPASTRKGTREFRYYVCAQRHKSGRDACSAAPLPAKAIEQYVVERIGEVAADQEFVASVTTALDRRLADRRTAVDLLCRTIPGRIASISAMTSKLTEEVLASSGPMRAAFEAKLRVEAEKLAEAEQQLAAAQRDRAVLDGLGADAQWVTSALADFAPVWNALTTTNRGRLLRALVNRVVVDEASGKVELHLIDLTGTGATDAREAA